MSALAAQLPLGSLRRPFVDALLWQRAGPQCPMASSMQGRLGTAQVSQGSWMLIRAPRIAHPEVASASLRPTWPTISLRCVGSSGSCLCRKLHLAKVLHSAAFSFGPIAGDLLGSGSGLIFSR